MNGRLRLAARGPRWLAARGSFVMVIQEFIVYVQIAQMMKSALNSVKDLISGPNRLTKLKRAHL